MVNRLLIVLLTRVFDKDNPVGVAAKAKASIRRGSRPT